MSRRAKLREVKALRAAVKAAMRGRANPGGTPDAIRHAIELAHLRRSENASEALETGYAEGRAAAFQEVASYAGLASRTPRLRHLEPE